MEIYLIILIVISALILIPMVLIFIRIFDLRKKVADKLKRFFSRNQAENIINMITNISTAAIRLSETGHGSIMVIERRDEVVNLFMDSQLLNAEINANLLINIFGGEESQPLHDGAVVIGDNKIKIANAFVKN